MTSSIIVFGGKGGAGKTTLASMVLHELVRTGNTPILAVDADPNATLALTLGVETGSTIADLRDRMGVAAQKVSEIPKDRLMDQWLAELLVEEAGFDLLTMGRPEGPKCYCYVNGLLRRYLKELRSNYGCVVVDCEAGMEYISRLVVDDVETFVLVSEPTPVGLASARRICSLADSLPVKVNRRILAINKVCGELSAAGAKLLDDFENIDVTIKVPFDSDIASRSERGEPVDQSAGDEARRLVEQLARGCLVGSSSGETGTTQKEFAS